jgi:Zn-dependent protease
MLQVATLKPLASMDPALIITAYIVFVYSTVCHEAAHAWVAHKLGDDTAYLGGQVSLDPIPHIKREPIGMVVVPLISLLIPGARLPIGWATAPLDPLWVQRHPQRSAVVAIAGPAANLLLFLLAAIIMFIGAKNGVFQPTRSDLLHEIVRGQKGTVWEFVAYVVSLVFVLNLLLAALNLLPAPPLDGSNIPLLFLKGSAAEAYQQMLRQPWMLLVTLVLIFRLFPVLFLQIYSVVVNVCNRWFF